MNDEDKKTLCELVTPQIDRLNPGDRVDCEGLFPPEFWKEIDSPIHRTYGVWIAQLVRARLLPLKRCGFTADRHNLYEKIRWEQAVLDDATASTEEPE